MNYFREYMSGKGRGGTGSTGTPLVVKLGGSLSGHIPVLAPRLFASPRPLLIVPGGGAFANTVRAAGLDDETAHWKAIAAMEQFGRSIAAYGLPFTEILAVPEKPVIFLPLRCLRERDPLPHSWDVTSDTIAAWVAAELGLDLVLLKSVDGILVDGALRERVSAAVTTDVVDPLFLPFVLEHRVNTTIINGSRPELPGLFLRGEPVRGTRISTTF